MTNHVHLLATQHETGGLSRMMQSLGRRYVRHFNHLHGRSGTLWEGRYRATVIDGEQYLLACMRYIEMNPVRTAMVAGPAGYPWSSHRVHAEGAPSSLVTPHPIYLELAATTELVAGCLSRLVPRRPGRVRGLHHPRRHQQGVGAGRRAFQGGNRPSRQAPRRAGPARSLQEAGEPPCDVNGL